MDNEAEALQAKIASLAGRINRHKNANDGVAPIQQQTSDHGNGHGQGLKHGSQNWTYQRGTPYGAPRGRGGWSARPTPHRHRSLVLNGPSQAQNCHVEASGTATEGKATPGWVTKRDRHMQLINNTVYERKTQERTQAMEETRRQKTKAREDREKAKLQYHLSALAGHGQSSTTTIQSPAGPHHIVVNDVRFVVTDGGSKLIRARGKTSTTMIDGTSSGSADESNSSRPTPRRANIGGVAFLRSKHGNLYRAGLVKTMRSVEKEKNIRMDIERVTNGIVLSRHGIKKIQQLCPQFTTTGTCPRGPHCRYIHDPNKVAICRDFLQTGECQAGPDCDLSHDPTPERVPACVHFLRGNCTNTNCRYAHVRVNPGAPVCRAFATLGYCSKGAECLERHVHECPDYANKGLCRNKKCRLPHVDRAGQLRKAAAQQDATSEADTASDISSDDDADQYDDDDVDSDDFDEDFLMPDSSHELSQQTDYVKF